MNTFKTHAHRYVEQCNAAKRNIYMEGFTPKARSVEQLPAGFDILGIGEYWEGAQDVVYYYWDDNSGAAWDMKENNAYLLPFDEEDW